MNSPRSTPTTARLERITGALLGVHAGDSLGATLEFRTWAQIRQSYPDGLREIIGGGPFGWAPGGATDDTDLTRAVLLGYLDQFAPATPDPVQLVLGQADPVHPSRDVVRLAADRMLEWFTGDWPGRTAGSTPPDVGGATMTGLMRYRSGGDPRASGAGEGQAGNGSLMRCIPTAFAVSDQAHRIQDSAEISAITHDDVRATMSCVAYNEIAAALIEGIPADKAVALGLAVAEQLASQPVADAIRYGSKLALAACVLTGQTFLEGEGRGYVLDSLSLAVAAALDPRSFEDVLVDVVRVGGDTDTNGAIAGGLLGARDGVRAIPARWVAVLQFADEFRAAAKQFATPG